MMTATLTSIFLRRRFPTEPTRYPIMVSSLVFNPSGTAAAANFRSIAFSTKATPPQHQSVTPPPDQEKKSFAVATGELFLSIAARILKRSGRSVGGGEEGGVAAQPEMSVGGERGREWWWRRRRKEGIGAVVEDPVEPGVVWEQGEKDVEAERRRKAVTSPGFSFSAAGLLFPYHLGAAQFLIEKGYIKVLRP